MSEPIRILHVIGIMNRGGAETMIMNLYRNIDRTKVQFDFVENTSDPAVFDEEILSLGGRIYRCPHYNGKNHFTYTKWWHSFFQSHKGEYPILHGHLGSTAAIYLAIAKRYGAYAIAHSHNVNRMRSASDIVYSFFAYPTRFVADIFFTCSFAAGISRYGKRIGNDKTRCTVMPNAIDTNRFIFDPDVRQQIRSHLGLSDRQFVVGNISRFSAQKNHDFLLDIFSKIHAKKPTSVLLLVGDGELRPQIEEKITALNLTDSVILAGIRDHTYAYYQAMDVILMPSLYEGLPVSLVEAQTAGLPCCVSDAVPEESAITELVQFRSLADPAEEWASWVLSRAGTPRRDMGKAVRAAGYDIAETSAWLEKFYQKVVNGRG